MNQSKHVAKKTGVTWKARNSLYFDCHLTSIAQVLPADNYYDFLKITTPIYFSNNWGGLAWKNGFDSEVERDVILFQQMGVKKSILPINGDIVQTIKDSIINVGYCITRVDSYYHEYFEEYFMKVHRTNGHKVTLIDFDDEYFYGIDNLGPKTLIMKFKIEFFIEAIYSNIYNVYEKYDTLYYLSADKEMVSEQAKPIVSKTMESFFNHRLSVPIILSNYIEQFEDDFFSENELRSMAQAKNGYTAAHITEISYGLLNEALQYDSNCIKSYVKESNNFLEKLSRVVKAWRMYKMLVKGYETSEVVSKEQIIRVLKSVIESEINLNDCLLIKARKN